VITVRRRRQDAPLDWARPLAHLSACRRLATHQCVMVRFGGQTAKARLPTFEDGPPDKAPASRPQQDHPGLPRSFLRFYSGPHKSCGFRRFEFLAASTRTEVEHRPLTSNTSSESDAGRTLNALLATQYDVAQVCLAVACMSTISISRRSRHGRYRPSHKRSSPVRCRRRKAQV
jgi:hypothetical protein